MRTSRRSSSVGQFHDAPTALPRFAGYGRFSDGTNCLSRCSRPPQHLRHSPGSISRPCARQRATWSCSKCCPRCVRRFGTGSQIAADPNCSTPLVPTCLCTLPMGADSGTVIGDTWFWSTGGSQLGAIAGISTLLPGTSSCTQALDWSSFLYNQGAWALLLPTAWTGRGGSGRPRSLNVIVAPQTCGTAA